MATFDPYSEQVMGLREQQALAQKLRDSGLEAPQGQMVSGHFVAPATTQYLAQALKGYLGGQDVQAAQQGIKDLMAQREAQNQSFLSAMPKSTETQVEVRTPETMNQMGPSPLSKALRVNPTTEDMLAWASKAPGLDTAAVAQLGVKGAELQAARDARIAEAQVKAQERAQEMRQRQEDRLDQMKFAASMRPERIVNLLGPNGESVATPVSQVGPGAALWSPAGAKHAQDVTSKETGRKGTSDTLDTLAGYYNKLNEGMGIESTQNRLGSNLGAWAGSTGIGNWAGRKFGTENASMRDSIDQTRPLLLADIKKATGMTASEMNSDKELQMWLSVATDPTKGYESNMRALQILEKKFGLGRGDEKNNPFLNAPPAAVGANVTVDY
jgi:predicted  nucleic acid-binding Zn ribbon protein